MANYERQSEAIAQRERECEAAVVKNGQDAPAANSQDGNVPKEPSINGLANRQSVAQCKAEADRENAQLTSHQRAEYEERAREERDRASLMEILTTSQQH